MGTQTNEMVTWGDLNTNYNGKFSIPSNLNVCPCKGQISSAVTTGFTVTFNSTYSANQLVKYLDIVVGNAAITGNTTIRYVIFSETMNYAFSLPCTVSFEGKTTSLTLAASKYGGGGDSMTLKTISGATISSPIDIYVSGTSYGTCSSNVSALSIYYDTNTSTSSRTYTYLDSGSTTSSGTNRKLPYLTVTSSQTGKTASNILLVLNQYPKERFIWSKGFLGASTPTISSSWTSANTSTYVYITGASITGSSSTSLSYWKTNYFNSSVGNGRWFPIDSGTTSGMLIVLMQTNSAGTTKITSWPSGSTNYVYALLGGGLYSMTYTQTEGNALNNDTQGVINSTYGRGFTLVRTLS